MDLRNIPRPFVADPGHTLTPEEIRAIQDEITPPERIKKHCMIEKDNMSYFTRQRRGRVNEY